MGAGTTAIVGADPNDVIQALKSIKKAGELADMIQKTPELISDLAKQASDALAITQKEIDTRSQFEDSVAKARSDLSDLQQQYTQTQQSISDAKTQADTDNKNTRDAADSYVKSSQSIIRQSWSDLDAYKSKLDARELQVAADEDKNKHDAAANQLLSSSLDDRKKALDDIASTLATRASQVSALEQAQLAG